MSNATILLKFEDPDIRRLIIEVDNSNILTILHEDQIIYIQNANNNIVAAKILRMNVAGRRTSVELLNSDDLRYFNQNDRITFNPPPDGGFKSKKRSKNKKRSKSKKRSKY